VDDWFEDLVEDIVWEALKDAYEWVAGTLESEVEAKLDSLTKGEKMSSSPLVKVLDVTPTTVTFLVRGRVPIYKKALSAFMRIEVVVSKDVDFTSGDPPIDIEDWHTVIGDIDISKKDVFSASLAFGYDDGAWLGQGSFKLLPAGFGLDILLGGLNDRGLMIGLDIDLPAAIPLGSTGLGLLGMGGDFAYNFAPRLEKAGVPIAEPTAEDYIRWARNHEVDRWVAGPIDTTAVGVGIRTDLGTVFDNGWTLKLEPIGLAVLTPGPVFVLGGVGKLLKTDSARIEGYLAVDIASGSLALGFGVRLKMPATGSATLLDGKGTLDALFSFRDPSIWYVNFGTDKKPITAKVMNGLWNAELFLMLNNDRVFFGAGLSIGGSWSWWIITLTARVGARVAVLIGWNPQELGGYFEIWGELGLKVWKFGFKLSGAARAIGHTPTPTQLDFEFRYKLDLPWPIPDITGKATFSYTDEDPIGPPLASPLLSGSATTGGATSSGELEMGGLHAITGRQWELGTGALWPDSEIVIPFANRATDSTGSVVGPLVGSYVQGGYDVVHTIEKLELRDLVNDEVVSGVKAVWAAGPGGDTARLHVLGGDPFSWLTPHTDTITTATETPGSFTLQRFGFGSAESFSAERRFGQLLITPATTADLTTDFAPALPTRVMSCDRFGLQWKTLAGDPIAVDTVVLYLVGFDREHFDAVADVGVQTSEGVPSLAYVCSLYGGLGLYAASISPTSPIEALAVQTSGKLPLLVYGVAALEKRRITGSVTSKTVLKPGRYRLQISGGSTAVHPSGSTDLPSSTPVAWSDSREFDVDYPESLRSYTREVTIGDERLFGPTTAWNPTMHGLGFPHYRGYRPTVRFLVPYMSDIFSAIEMSITFDDGVGFSQSIAPTTDPSGQSSLATVSKNWVTAAGGTVGPDEELVFTTTISDSGPATVRLSFTHPTHGDVKLDEWSAHVSSFDDFAAHLAWPDPCIRVLYGATGRRTVPCCPSLPRTMRIAPRSRGWAARVVESIVGFVVTGLRRVVELVTPWRSRGRARSVLDVTPVKPFPDELSTPPIGWRLGPDLVGHLGGLHEASGIDYARFAMDCGVRFDNGTGEPLIGLGDRVAETTIEALVDGADRPYALWLRTPEPIDWRRVSGRLRIRHVTPPNGCPTEYAKRHALDLDLDVLPSPDATSAFLVGRLAGKPTRLPRGEYRLTLSFDPAEPGLVELRRPPAAGSTETVVHTFLQPHGTDWPLPSTGVLIPAIVLEYLDLEDLIDPDIIWELTEKVRPWDPVPGPLPGPVVDPGPLLRSGPGSVEDVEDVVVSDELEGSERVDDAAVTRSDDREGPS
jgi:hypothetical protein